MRKTKIVATLGPASCSEQMIEKLILAGANVFRLNFSHGTREQHKSTAATIRQVAKKHRVFIGILADLQGPKIRIANFKNNAIQLIQGDSFILNADLDSTQGDEQQVGLDYPQLVQEVTPGNILLLDDGNIQLKVRAVNNNNIETVVTVGGKLSNRKGINLLGGGLSAPALTDKDKQDIHTAAAIQADYIAVSFPRNGADIEYARRLIVAAGSQAKIVAKVERAEVVSCQANMDDIIKASDVIMVARGDLAVEIGDACLPGAQKQLIARCRALGCPVITATQMMESMIENPMPTRAEVMDIANAVGDGTDAVMLSAETAAGKYPEEAVRAMARVAEGAERSFAANAENPWQSPSYYSQTGRWIALAATTAAFHNDQHLSVAALTENGKSVTLLSRFMPNNNIYALTDNPALAGQLTVLRGVTPVTYQRQNNHDGDESIMQKLQTEGLLTDINSLLITRLSTFEKTGESDCCHLVPVKQVTTALT
ncbi:pyruvate kinase [Proteus mirabilis]|uniref:pyruvate kinase n=1 Tax=Proteus mirabilis TaxID=584 RepID=UPI0029E9490F|nr:pyruvate kinase [Proteus mirabilis]HEJ9663115.1 pyruvate kinase [Proteus mirabilis]